MDKLVEVLLSMSDEEIQALDRLARRRRQMAVKAKVSPGKKKVAKKAAPAATAKKKAATPAASPQKKGASAKKSSGTAFRARLKAMAKQWNMVRGEAKESLRFDLEEGRYIFWVTGELSVSQGAGNLQIHWKHKVANKDSEAVGKVQHSWDGLDNPDRLIFVAQKFARLGYEVEEMDAEDIEELLAELQASPVLVEGQVKHKEGNDRVFVNVYLNRVLDAEEMADEIIGFDESVPKAEESEEEEEGEEEEGEEEEGEEEEEEGDDLDGMDRSALKKFLKDNEIEFKVLKSTTDDEIREAIREAQAGGEEEEEEEASEEEEAEDEEAGGEEEEGEEEESEPPKKGDKVWTIVKGKTVEGKLLSVSGDKGKIKTEDGKTIEVKMNAVEKLDVPFE